MYADGLQQAYKLVLPRTVIHSFSKSSTPLLSPVDSQRPRSTISETEPAELPRKPKMERAAVILPYKHKGFADDLIKRSKEIPGPGAYNIGPPAKIY
jgi:hypothetical protein